MAMSEAVRAAGKTPRAILLRLRDLIEAGWCQHALVAKLDTRGVPVPLSYQTGRRRATHCCLVGGLMLAGDYVERQGMGPLYIAATRLIERSIPYKGITKYNDAKGRRKATILRAIDRAIALSEQETENADARV